MDSTIQITEEQKKNYTFDGTTYIYTDKDTEKVYKWDVQNSSWVEVTSNEHIQNVSLHSTPPKASSKNDEEFDSEDDEKVEKVRSQTQDMSQGVYGYEDDTHTYTDTRDGTVYFWDKEKSAWFPKIDDTFIAYYQMNYGFNESSENQQPQPEKKSSKEKPENEAATAAAVAALKRKAEPEPPKWFDLDAAHNTKVYVSNLPIDITESEFVDLMQKCGLVMKDIETNKLKVKLYMDPISKELKGDALCTYIKKESVDLALQLLDGYDVRGRKIKIERAQFTMRGNTYDPSLKPKKKRRKDKEKIKKIQERLFAWQPDKLRGERGKNEKVVVIKNLFDPDIFDENLALVIEYQQDIREECSKCGAVKKVVIYDKHKDGIAQVFFKDAEAADACIQLLNNRWFSKRLITAETWDGKTKYKIEETEAETEARLKKWEDYLNSNKENNSEENISESALDENDSDGTRSSAGSGDETDEENGQHK